MLKFAFNLVDDGMVGQQVFAGEATRLAYMTDEAAEGRDAFLEKRAPDWSPSPTTTEPMRARLVCAARAGPPKRDACRGRLAACAAGRRSRAAADPLLVPVPAGPAG